MSTVNNEINKKPGVFIRHVVGPFARRLPRRVKRFIYVSSILGVLEQTKRPDVCLVEKLNEVLKLANKSDAYMFPIYIHSLIWGNLINGSVTLENGNSVKLCEIKEADLSERDYDIVADTFSRLTPGWLQYGSLGLMKHDVVSLMSELFKFNDAQRLAVS